MPKSEPSKPLCYRCKFRRDIPGDAHSRCNHPEASPGSSPLADVMSIFASAGRVPPVANAHAAGKLNISANAHGIRQGWFNWPFNFDPVWLQNCDGYTQTELEENHGRESD